MIVVVSKNGASDDGESSVGADKIVGEEIDKVKHTAESGFRDVHRSVFAGNYDYVFFKIDERRKLHKPFFTVEFEGNCAQGLTCGVTCVACKTYVFGAEQAFGITRFGFFGATDFFGSFFGKVYRDDDFAARIVVLPLNVTVDVGTADIRRFFREFAEPFGGFHTAFVCRDVVELFYDFGGRRSEYAHKFGFEKQSVGFFADVLFDRVLRQRSERCVKVVVFGRCGSGFGEFQHIEQYVGHVYDVRFVKTEVADCVVDEVCNVGFCYFFKRFTRGHKTSEHPQFSCNARNAVVSLNSTFIIYGERSNGNTFDGIF